MTIDMGKTLYEKIWDAHAILQGDDGQTLLHVARHMAHDGSGHAFEFLQDRGLTVRRPDQTFATPDHGSCRGATTSPPSTDPEQRRVVELLAENTRKFGIVHFALDDPRQGIVHVVGPEQGITQPGDGAGLRRFAHIHARRAGCPGFRPRLERHPARSRDAGDLAAALEDDAHHCRGGLPAGVTAKDVILAIIARIGANGAAGHVIEYAGSTVRAMSIEERLTVCNMSIEAGARAGMVAPDETTYAYLQ